MFFVVVGTHPKCVINEFALDARIDVLIFQCHTVTNGIDLRRSPLVLIPCQHILLLDPCISFCCFSLPCLLTDNPMAVRTRAVKSKSLLRGKSLKV